MRLFVIVLSTLLVIGCSNNQPIGISHTDISNTAVITGISKLGDRPYTGFFASMIQSQMYPNNTEIVRRNSSGGIDHLWAPKNNTVWNWASSFGTQIQSDPSICVNYIDGLLQVVARDGINSSKVTHYWRKSDVVEWVKQDTFGTNCIGNPSIICNKYSCLLEVIVKQKIGSNPSTLQHYIRTGNGWQIQSALPIPTGHTLQSASPAFTQFGSTSNGGANGGRVVFAITKSGSTMYICIFTRRYNSSTWSTTTRAYSPLDATPLSASGANNNVYLLYQKSTTNYISLLRLDPFDNNNTADDIYNISPDTPCNKSFNGCITIFSDGYAYYGFCQQQTGTSTRKDGTAESFGANN